MSEPKFILGKIELPPVINMPRPSRAKPEALPPDHAKAIDSMLHQLLIALVKRAGGTIEMPASEVDATGQDLLSMKLDPVTRTFTFVVTKKS